jgi:glycosyltransferase involved in cell wall biosynthesis
LLWHNFFISYKQLLALNDATTQYFKYQLLLKKSIMKQMALTEFSSFNDLSGDLVCFSHLRWDFVYQRPQHLMSRLAKKFRVFFIEEPVYCESNDTYTIKLSPENVWVVTPCLQQKDSTALSVQARQKILINKLFANKKIQRFIAWYYTPMALKISNHLQPMAIIYDCMDELSAFKFAPAELKLLEAELFKKAALVFTGGQSLYNAKKDAHHNIYPFPSSIDKHHFSQARKRTKDPADQAAIPPTRFGFYGVIDERFNIGLINEVAKRKPEWQFILIGPVVKIDEKDLPRHDNIHYLGSKSYNELPAYLSGWDIAMIPFEKNESTQFISPTKTPEYLAAGKPVISASITDVVHPYFTNGLVHIADTADDFIKAAEKELAMQPAQRKQWLQKVDKFLEHISWDITAMQMLEHINACLSIAAKPGGILKSVA